MVSDGVVAIASRYERCSSYGGRFGWDRLSSPPHPVSGFGCWPDVFVFEATTMKTYRVWVEQHGREIRTSTTEASTAGTAIRRVLTYPRLLTLEIGAQYTITVARLKGIA